VPFSLIRCRGYYWFHYSQRAFGNGV
jgi:hypothetical protein